MTPRSLAPWLVVVALIAAFLARGIGGGDDGGGSGRSSDRGGVDARAGATLQATVKRVVDGDTIKVTIAGATETVRYIGMDTPESVKPDTPVQCYAERASARNESLVPKGTALRLVVGAEPRDRYGRLLAYVYRSSDDLLIESDLLRGGYAHTLTIPPNDRLAPSFAVLQDQARTAHRGLWGACPGLAASYP